MPALEPAIEALRPRNSARVYDLVQAAGHDVRPWADFKRGPKFAAANPKYCYEWSFLQEGVSPVVNLWIENFEAANGIIFQRMNLRERATLPHVSQTRFTLWRRRALMLDAILAASFAGGVPLRVIICEGALRDAWDENAKTSKVKKRALDERVWFVSEYDLGTGQAILVRGSLAVALPVSELVNANSDMELLAFEGQPRAAFIKHRHRESRMRGAKVAEVLRATGKLVCEVTGCAFDFQRTYGSLGEGYCHVHHKKPLWTRDEEGEVTRLEDLAIVCPNCHAMIHRGGQCRTVTEITALIADAVA